MKILAILFVSLLSIKTPKAQELLWKISERKLPTSQELLTRLSKYPLNVTQVISPWEFSSNKNVNDSIRLKLFSLIKNEWSDSEIESSVNYHLNRDFKNIFEAKFWNAGLKDSITNIAVRRKLYFDSAFHFVYDSIALNYKQLIKHKLLNNKIPDEIILATATAKMYNAIPILMKDITDSSNYRIDFKVAEIALAGLGVKKYQQKFMNLYKKYYQHDLKGNFNAVYPFSKTALNGDQIMMIIGTQESVSLLAFGIDTSSAFKIKYNKNSPERIIPADPVNLILWFIKNNSLKAGFQKQPAGDVYKNEASPEQVLFVKKWLAANKGKYEFD